MKLKDIDISKLKGVALDYAVAKLLGKKIAKIENNYVFIDGSFVDISAFIPTTKWDQCGELIDLFKIDFGYDALEEKESYFAIYFDEVMSGNSYQEAACRVVVWIHGDKELEIPNELLKE